jgi:TonB-linked SusC/RagA family outer membrane protein
MKKFSLIVAMLLFVATTAMFAQRTVTGTVTDESGETLISVNVVVKGTSIGAITDLDGKYLIKVPEGSNTLVFSYTGFSSQDIELGASNVEDVQLLEGIFLNDVVVTALGIEREKKSLGYATQEVSGDEVTTVKDANFINSLSGKVAGVDIRRSNEMGGSSNVIIRGYKSLTGNNQALFVVDGIPMSNDNTNTTNQQTGRGGYDYGNAAMDINPEDIETINVLKGAAATALYGSRAANGVILITTKKGKKRKGLGVTVGTGVTFGQIDKSTMPRYQDKYGPGYGQFYANGGLEEFDFGDGVGLSTPTYEDASYGSAFDPNLAVYDWRSYYPQMPDWYATKFPFTAGANNPTSFYETSATYNTNVAIDGGTDKSSYRLSYTNFNQSGILPNSNITKNTVSLSAGYDVNDKLTVTSSVNYVYTEGLGRYGTGYDNRNVNQSFRQWYNVGVDIADLERAYDETGLNISWNPKGPNDPSSPTTPNYFDNFYFNRSENYSTDNRSRIFGNIQLQYEVTDWLNLVGRVTTDRYSEVQEERIAVGSVDVAKYSRYNRSFEENNFDLFLNANKYLGTGDKINLSGMIGTNLRRSNRTSIFAETNGGLVVPGLYALGNSVSGIESPTETASPIDVNGFYARGTIGFSNMLYLDLTARQDYSSTLPSGGNGYFYPSASLSFIFSEVINSSFIDFGKVRLNYARVGNDAPFASIDDVYLMGTPFDGPLSSVPSRQNNEGLLPEETNNIEAGVEMYFWNNRIGLDASVYQSNTLNQIIPVTVSGSTGSLSKFVNAGNIENKGVEVALTIKAIKTRDFSWNVAINWARNRNKVIELYEGQSNLQLASVQGGVTINATVGESFGSIWGSDYVYDSYDADGNPSVGASPVVEAHNVDGVRYLRTTTPGVIGNINPDWKGGINNRFTYKNLAFSFLVDMQKGGDFFSLDTWYGYATGIYDFTAEENSNGNSVRDLPSDGGGFIIDGAVTQTGTDGSGNPTYSPNTEAFFGSDYRSALGYARAPNAYHIWDATFIKLREVSLTYSLPAAQLTGSPFTGVNVSLVGRNLWIIYKSSTYSDPESGLSSGNFQGNQSGAYPAVREVGVNVSVKF